MKNLVLFMGDFKWSPDKGIDVSSRGREPYKLFSPFSHDAAYQIPVPGQESTRADSVEGIWQGLKIVNGQTDFSLFTGKPSKRKGKPDGHQYGENVLSYVNARQNIYLPAYVYHAVNNALPNTWPDLEQRIQNEDVVLHDVEKNGSIKDTSRPLAHSSILVHLLNVIKDAPLPKVPALHPNPHKSDFTYLHEQVNALVEYRSSLKSEDREMLDEVISFAYLFSPEVKKQDFSLSVIKKAGINCERLDRYQPNKQTKEIYSSLRR